MPGGEPVLRQHRRLFRANPDFSVPRLASRLGGLSGPPASGASVASSQVSFGIRASCSRWEEDEEGGIYLGPFLGLKEEALVHVPLTRPQIMAQGAPHFA